MRFSALKILSLWFGFAVIACDFAFDKNDDCETRVGAIVAKTLVLDSFRIVEPRIINVRVSVGNEQLVIARGNEKVIDALSTEVSDGVWLVTFSGGRCYVDYQLDLEVTISKNNINAIGQKIPSNPYFLSEFYNR